MPAELLDIGNVLGWAVILTYLRVQACILAMPGFGERVLPGRVKVAIAMALTPILAETTATVAAPATVIALLGAAAAELLLGFAAGALVRLMAFSINIAATAIAATASLSQIIGAPNEASPHPIGNFFHLGGLALLLAMGLPIMLVRLLADSLSLWPVGRLPDADGLLTEVVAVVAHSFELAMVLAAPFILGGFLFQALSGVINKVMPALPVVFIGAPAAIMLALVALALLTPLMMGIWTDAVLSLQLGFRR